MSFKPKKDSRWDYTTEDGSSEPLERLVDQIEFHQNVSVDINKRFEVVKKLILHSYFEYEFLDVASNQALFSFEMALKQRYEEVTDKKVEDISLYKLIKWGAANYLFEDDEQVIHSLRKLRNSKAHPEQYSLGGYANFDIILRTVEIINDMYEDPQLRKDRIEKSKEINKDITNFTEWGSILEVESKRYIIFCCTLLYLDNKSNDELYHILIWPIFDPEFQDRHMQFCDPFLFKVVQIQFEDNIIIFELADGSEIRLDEIKKIDNKKRYYQFLRGYCKNIAAQEIIRMRIGENRLAVIREQ